MKLDYILWKVQEWDEKGIDETSKYLEEIWKDIFKGAIFYYSL